jgi:hypothetical protein
MAASNRCHTGRIPRPRLEPEQPHLPFGARWLYPLYQASSAGTGTLVLHVSPGVQAYDFTFG